MEVTCKTGPGRSNADICRDPAFFRAQTRQHLTRYLPLVIVLSAAVVFGGCAVAPTPALHVIGVYKGTSPAGVDDQPQLDVPLVGFRVLSPANGQNQEVFEPTMTEKEVLVNLDGSTGALVLAFTAYEPTLWRVQRKDHAQIVKVILAGNHTQRVTGLPPDTPIEAYTSDPSPCEHCWQSDQNFYSYERVPPQLQEVTGLEASSFQGSYTGTEFTIPPKVAGSSRSEHSP